MKVCFFFFFFFKVVACGSSQARGRIRAVAAAYQGLNIHPHGYWILVGLLIVSHNGNSLSMHLAQYTLGIIFFPVMQPIIEFVSSIITLLVFFVCFCLLGSHPRHMDVPRLGIQSELQPLAYATAHGNTRYLTY